MLRYEERSEERKEKNACTQGNVKTRFVLRGKIPLAPDRRAGICGVDGRRQFACTRIFRGCDRLYHRKRRALARVETPFC